MPGGGGGGGHAHHGGGPAPTAEIHVAVPDRFLPWLKPVYAAYFDAHEALARDDLGGFVAAAEDLERAIGVVDTVGLVGEPLGTWRRAAARLTLDRAPTDIEEARSAFERMSKAVLDLEKGFGHRGSRTWHAVFCPMAFDNKGAQWLQRGDVIRNPYFGASMPRCGEIRAEFKPLGRATGQTGDGGGSP